MPDLSPEQGSDFYFVEANEPESAMGKLLAIVTERIPKRFGLDPIRDAQVLCPMNRGSLGARSLNLELQQLLNPRRELPKPHSTTTLIALGKVEDDDQIENQPG
jgi:exodeoxyribonuclease V alpha subunit